MRHGVRIWCRCRLCSGRVARSDPAGTLAFTHRDTRRGETDITEICHLAAEYEAIEILVGLPLAFPGKRGLRPESPRHLPPSLR